MPTRTREHLFLSVVIALFLVGVATIAFLVWVAGAYGVWSVSDVPEKIPLCDQTYTKRDDRVLRYAEAVPRADPSPIILEPTIGRLPITLGAQPSRYEAGAAYNGCGSYLLLRVGHDAYVVYAKLGGG